MHDYEDGRIEQVQQLATTTSLMASGNPTETELYYVKRKREVDTWEVSSRRGAVVWQEWRR